MVSNNKLIALATIAIGAIVADSILLVPEPLSWTGTWLVFHVPLAVLVLMTTLNSGAALLFLKSMHVYKPELRRAFQAIAAGMVLIAIGSLQLPIVNGFDLWDAPWIRFGGIGLPFIISAFVLYGGVRVLARLVGVKTVWMHIALTFGLSLVAAVLITLVPHAPTDSKEIAFDMSTGVAIFNGVFIAISAFILYKVARRIGAHYAPALTWLLLALGSGVCIPLLVVLHSILTGAKSVDSLDTMIVFLIHGALTLTAGYMFAKTKEY